MPTDDLVKVWKDPEVRMTQRATVPHPAGEIELPVPRGAPGNEDSSFTCTFIICTWTRPCDPTVYFSCSGGCDETS